MLYCWFNFPDTYAVSSSHASTYAKPATKASSNQASKFSMGKEGVVYQRKQDDSAIYLPTPSEMEVFRMREQSKKAKDKEVLQRYTASFTVH